MDVFTSLGHKELRALEKFVETCGDEGVNERQFVEAVSALMMRRGKTDRKELVLRGTEQMASEYSRDKSVGAYSHDFHNELILLKTVR